jgi:endogenous inhibitor of DNA gyrase (YacG/DUF329 family)
VETDKLYCPFDGAELEHIDAERRCPRCGAPAWYHTAKFCSTCGAKLDLKA